MRTFNLWQVVYENDIVKTENKNLGDIKFETMGIKEQVCVHNFNEMNAIRVDTRNESSEASVNIRGDHKRRLKS